MTDHTVNVGYVHVGLPGSDDFICADDCPHPAHCTGVHDCDASLHVHGCYADRGGSACDAPDEHMPHIGGPT